MTLRGQTLVSRTDDDAAVPSVCPFKTSLCMPAPRAHVEKHVRVLPAYTATFLNVHTGFSACHNTHRHTQHNTESHTTSHGERGKERETRQEERSGEQTRDKMKKKREEMMFFYGKKV